MVGINTYQVIMSEGFCICGKLSQLCANKKGLNCDGYCCSKLAYNDSGYMGKFAGSDFLGNEKAKDAKELSELKI
ncbi:hypothetical protein ACFLZ5_06235 [Thermodesulfobacteriota bacterium]